MKLHNYHIFLLALVVGWLACSVPCRARVLSQSSAVATAENGTASADASTSETGSSSSATATSTGGSASSSASASAGSSTATAGAGGAPSIVSPGQGLDDLAGLFRKIYENVARRTQNGEDPKPVAQREVNIQRMNIAGVWGSVLGSVGLRGRGAECDDIEGLIKTQSNDFAQALIDGLAAAKGGLSVSAENDIRETIDSGMGEAFKNAADAACSITGFSLGSRLKFGSALIEPVSDAIVIAARDEGINFDRTVDPEEVDDKPEEVEMEKESSDGVDGSAVERTSTGDTLRCSKKFIVCCLDRKILSEKCDCLAGRCDAIFEDGMWKDASGSRCTCS